MRVRFLNSTEGGDFFKALMREISNQGFEVIHQFTVSEQAYRRGRTGLSKYVNLWKMYPWYCLKTFAALPSGDVFVSTTNPFFLPATVRMRVGSRRPTVFLVYDLYPDALELSNLLSPQGWLSRVCAMFTGYAIRNSSATVFLGDVLREHIESRYGKANKSVVVPVGADGEPFVASPPKCIDESVPIRIIYCGNLGRAHDSATLLEYLESGSDSRFEFQFHSFGSKFNQLRERLRGGGVGAGCSLNGPLASADWVEAMLAAHVALVTVSPGWEKVVMPSKVYSAMVSGQAVLAICPQHSDLAELVRKHDCGWVVSPGDVAGLRNVLMHDMSDHKQLAQKRQNSFTAGHAYYSCQALARRWAELFKELTQSSRAGSQRQKTS